MRSEIVKQILKDTPLEVTIKVSNQIAFIDLITELGYRENKSWDENDEEDNRILLKLTSLADQHTKNQMKHIDKHYSK